MCEVGAMTEEKNKQKNKAGQGPAIPGVPALQQRGLLLLCPWMPPGINPWRLPAGSPFPNIKVTLD